VQIPLSPGLHVLYLQVNGLAPNGRVRTDRDLLVFFVP